MKTMSPAHPEVEIRTTPQFGSVGVTPTIESARRFRDGLIAEGENTVGIWKNSQGEGFEVISSFGYWNARKHEEELE